MGSGHFVGSSAELGHIQEALDGFFAPSLLDGGFTCNDPGCALDRRALFQGRTSEGFGGGEVTAIECFLGSTEHDVGAGEIGLAFGQSGTQEHGGHATGQE